MSAEDKEKQDLFGLEEEESDVDSTAEQDEVEDSRFSSHRLRSQAFGSGGESDSDLDDDSDADLEHENMGESGEESSDDEGTEEKADDDASKTNDGHADETQPGTASKDKSRKKKKVKKLTAEELEKFEEEQKKTGVCYLSRIPPFMTPHKLRSLLSHYAEIGRMYLAPEDPKITARRKKYTKNRSVNYTEGWVEFKDKKRAKALALFLNMKQIGGRRKDRFYHEMWNIKYLPKFKWNHLNEQMAYERMARQQRLQAEIAQSNRENKTYIQNVERAKMINRLEEKKRKRGEEEKELRRTFKQRAFVEREVDADALKQRGNAGKEAMNRVDAGVKNVLGQVFGK
ncbi:uncharacterized protein BYT42DRAFT_618730 [Radiomyces spectabilis]|uniref:uncharacterized protein n=1 Tax=Radiomyces spectabilis TaxID=64574 RepID=UPI0022208DF3|nr:uncharacterized protein BYT42DRAFT_618730 [Radiomyces spectabilis]KAI8365353.1 hypothetical protein BYT42DRAFT_618730 [Radiomyces spectabilis]